jgi:hypothetical protein
MHWKCHWSRYNYTMYLLKRKIIHYIFKYIHGLLIKVLVIPHDLLNNIQHSSVCTLHQCFSTTLASIIPGPHLTEKQFTKLRSDKGWEPLPYITLNHTLLFHIIYNKNVFNGWVLARFERQGITYGKHESLLSFRCTWWFHSGRHTILNYL